MIPPPDQVTSAEDQVTSHDPSAIFGVVEEPVSSIVHTQEQPEPVKPVSETGLAGLEEEQAMETETEGSQISAASSSGKDAPPEMRSFTPPPTTVASDSGSTAEAGSQTHSSGLGNGNETADDTMPLPSEGEEEDKMETETQVSVAWLVAV